MYQDILLALDLGHAEAEMRAVDRAVEYARTFGSRLHLITVVPDFGMSIVGSYFPKGFEKRAVEEARKALHEFSDKHVPADVVHRHIVGQGSIYREILHHADQIKADLIVVSASRPGFQDYLIGPNAARVVRHATISVLVVR